jgi:uncharacterized membrane protein
MVSIALAGAFLRFFRLDAQSFWGDEALSSLIAASSSSDVLNNALASVNPPGYYFVLHVWQSLAGGSDLALRFPSALMGLLGIPLIYRLGRSVRSKQLGLWAAAGTALAPFHVFYSQEARMYTQLHAVVCVLMLAYVRLWQGGGRAWWIAFFLASVAGLWTHFFAGLAIAVLGAHFFILKLWLDRIRPSSPQSPGAITRPSWFHYSLVTGATLILFGLYLPHFFSQVQMVESEGWRAPPSVSRLVGLPLSLTASQFLGRLPQLVAFGLITLLTIVVALQVARVLWQKGPAVPWVSLLALLSLVPPLLAFVISWVWRPVFSARVLIISMPAIYLLLVWGATHTRERRFNQLVLLVLLIFMGWGLHNWYFDPAFAKPAVRDAAQRVQGSETTGAPVIHGTATSYRLFEHYAGELDNYLLSGSPMTDRSRETFDRRGDGLIEPTDVPASGFWYILFPVHSLQFQTSWRDRFDTRFDREREWRIGGTESYYYVEQTSENNAGTRPQETD